MSVGVIENQDGTLQVMFPSPRFTAQEAMDLAGQVGHIVPKAELPSVKIPQEAWRYEPVGNTIIIDVATLKDIVIGENERVVARQLKAIRPAWEEAVDNDDNAQIAAIKSDRQNIRNTLASKTAAINACTTAAEVEAYLP